VIALVALLVARYVAAQMRLARVKDELVSTVSHELKTPLTSIRALVDTLSARGYRDELLQEYLQLIGKENLRLCHLIENFLTFSRLERGRERFRFEDLAPAVVVATAVETLKERLASTQCDFAVRVEPDLPRIRGDAAALSTVLINLLDNAWKYTAGEKRISVRAFAEGRQVCFEVEDNGIGLDRREARKIFDRFYQVDQSLTRQQGGCGLGLSIVKFIVAAHDGEVEVQSEPGQGSTFRVKIPLAKIQPAPETDRAADESRSAS
jgi:signal transduction histidine kinase